MLLLNLINDILDITRIEAGQLPLEFAPLQIRRCLSEVAQMLAPKAAEKKLKFELNISKELEGATFVGDSKRLQQARLGEGQGNCGDTAAPPLPPPFLRTAPSPPLQSSCACRSGVHQLGVERAQVHGEGVRAPARNLRSGGG